ncbi:MAG: hypothetical protein K1X94_08205 [Sandaracinaceae bacterium]|nr:hypothetical protein [Sandaracinaceae bacterium]
MWARLHPWATAVLAGYSLSGACLGSFLVLPLGFVPSIVRALANRPPLAAQSLAASIRTSMVALPLLVVHLGISMLARRLAVAFNWPPSGLVPFAVAVVSGPLALPWLGIIAYAGEPPRVAAARAFDRWDERGLLAWAIHGLVLGAMLGGPFLVFTLGDGVVSPDEPLVRVASVGFVPASLGVGARYAAEETRRISRHASRPVLATTVMVIVGTAVPLSAGLLGWQRATFLFTPGALDYAVFFGPPILLPCTLLVVAWWWRESPRPVRVLGATTRGELLVDSARVVAEEGAELLFDDGAVWTIEPGGSLVARIESSERVPTRSRLDVCVLESPHDGTFRGVHARDSVVELRPYDSGSSEVRVAQGGWLALAHATMVSSSVLLWSQLAW